MAKQNNEQPLSEIERQVMVRILKEALQILEKNAMPPIYATPPLQDVVIYLNAGHGNVDPATGKYKTFPQDGKFYQFIQGGKVVFTAYEGQTNRMFADALALRLVELGAEVVKVYHPIEDRTNQERIFIANSHWAKAKQAGKKGTGLSFHSNAVGTRHQGESLEPRGTSFFTSVGKTESDQFAQVWQEKIKEEAEQPYIVSHRGIFEADFYECVASAMPWVLFENLFFTNLEDAHLLYDTKYQNGIVEATVKALLSYFAPKNLA